MKFDFNKLSLIVLIMMLLKSYFPLKLNLQKLDDLKIDDKEIESMLNDPKFSSLSADLNKLKNSRAEMEKAKAELTSIGVDVDKKDKDKSVSDPLKDLGLGGLGAVQLDSPPSSLLKTGFDKPKKSSLSNGNEDILSKLGDFKDLGLDIPTTKPDDSSVIEKKEEKAPPPKKNPQDEKFKNLDYLTKQQARLLLEILKQPVFFGMLPQEAQNIVKAVTDGSSFKDLETSNLDKFIETSLENSVNSSTFIDPDGTIGRKGMLTIINPENGEFKYVWTISNSRVLCFYQSQSFLTIVKLFRNRDLSLKNINTTPCFLIHSKKNIEQGSLLICTSSILEKEVWIQTILNNL